MYRSNYDKFPATRLSGAIARGWDDIRGTLDKAPGPLLVETYTGVNLNEVTNALAPLSDSGIILTPTLMKPEDEIVKMTKPFMTGDALFGVVTALSLEDYFDPDKLRDAREEIMRGKKDMVIGPGAALLSESGTLAYIDMARWEIQQRMRRREVRALGIDNSGDPISIQYKRGYFNDWRILDRHKEELFYRIDYWLDTHQPGDPKMICHDTFIQGLNLTASKPFRVVPFFDPAPWGGQWMKEKCDLDRSKPNFGWCFDCVPEENSLYLDIDGTRFEMPAVNLILLKSREVLGDAVEARFGKDFPIRFDFLDTVGGGNLSLQVHPTSHFIRREFGIHYTQDESYYLLDAEEDATVYIGLKTGADKKEMFGQLRKAQAEGTAFDVEKHVNRIPARKHDHFLIPGGTIHCSGAGALVLEISSTPNIFTFKLYDWQRLGLDGKPRPINIDRGEKVIDFSRDTEYVEKHLHNHFEKSGAGEGWSEERTGLHPNEFIETRRHRFTAPVTHHTEGSVNVLNLVEGREAVVESPSGAFEPFVVHYAETFIIPAAVNKYTIRPFGESEGHECITIKAYVRI